MLLTLPVQNSVPNSIPNSAPNCFACYFCPVNRLIGNHRGGSCPRGGTCRWGKKWAAREVEKVLLRGDGSVEVEIKGAPTCGRRGENG